MKQNVGNLDHALRLTARWWPVYLPFGMSTCKVEKSEA